MPQLQAGQDTGRDIVVITNGEYLAALIQNGWATELDPNYRPNFDANAASWAKSPFYDEGNKHTMAWQSGLTGVGYNTELAIKPPTKLDDLMSTDYFRSGTGWRAQVRRPRPRHGQPGDRPQDVGAARVG